MKYDSVGYDSVRYDITKSLPKIRLTIKLGDSVVASNMFKERLWNVEVLAHADNAATFLFSFPDEFAFWDFYNQLHSEYLWPFAKMLSLTLVRTDLTEFSCDLRTVGPKQAKCLLLLPHLEQGFAEDVARNEGRT